MSILAVYDCMLFFAQATRPERARETFELVRRKVVTLCISAEILSEVRDVLGRPEYRTKFPALTDAAVESLFMEIAALALHIDEVPEVFVLARDPKDSKYVNLALAAGAPYLVTRDNDLLDLMDPATVEGVEFIRRFPNLRILEPREFVQEINPDA